MLRNWFDGRGKLTDSLRAHIKQLARNALTELAFDWITGGTGSPEAVFRLLFLLSDFEFFESTRELDELTRSLASQSARYIGAAQTEMEAGLMDPKAIRALNRLLETDRKRIAALYFKAGPSSEL